MEDNRAAGEGVLSGHGGGEDGGVTGAAGAPALPAAGQDDWAQQEHQKGRSKSVLSAASVWT